MYKIGNVGHQQRELRFPLGILHCHSLPPACWERGAKALIPIGSLYRECRKQVGDSTQCLHISLDVASWRSAYAPFPPRKHCWPLVQVLESLLSINHWHRPAKIGAIWADRVAHICQRHWVGHMSLAMFYFFLACVLQKRVAQCVGTSCREVHLRKASCSMSLKLRERQSCCNCEQCAKAEPKISSTSAWDRSTVCSCWQLAQAAEPILLKSVGKASATMPASRKQQSGKHRFGCAASGSGMPKLM